MACAHCAKFLPVTNNNSATQRTGAHTSKRTCVHEQTQAYANASSLCRSLHRRVGEWERERAQAHFTCSLWLFSLSLSSSGKHLRCEWCVSRAFRLTLRFVLVRAWVCVRVCGHNGHPCLCVSMLFVCAHACKRERITRSHHAELFAHNVVNVFLPPSGALIFSVRIETLWRTVENLSVSSRKALSALAPKQQQQHRLEKKRKKKIKSSSDKRRQLCIVIVVVWPLWSILCNIDRSKQASKKNTYRSVCTCRVCAFCIYQSI